MKALKWQLMQSKLSVLMPSDGLVLNFFREWGHSHRGGGQKFHWGRPRPGPPWNRPWIRHSFTFIWLQLDQCFWRGYPGRVLSRVGYPDIRQSFDLWHDFFAGNWRVTRKSQSSCNCDLRPLLYLIFDTRNKTENKIEGNEMVNRTSPCECFYLYKPRPPLTVTDETLNQSHHEQQTCPTPHCRVLPPGYDPTAIDRPVRKFSDDDFKPFSVIL